MLTLLSASGKIQLQGFCLICPFISTAFLMDVLEQRQGREMWEQKTHLTACEV